MRYFNRRTVGIQAILVLLLSISAVYVFSSSFAFTALSNLLSRYFSIEPMYLFAILTILILLAGLSLVLMKKNPSVGNFVSLVALFYIPSSLASSTINWTQILGLEFQMKTDLSPILMLLLSLLVVTGYVLLRFTVIDNRLALEAVGFGYHKEDLDNVSRSEHIWMFLIVATATVAAFAIYLVSVQINNTLAQTLQTIRGNMFLLGIIFSLIFIGIVYIVIVRGRQPIPIHKPETNGQPDVFADVQQEYCVYCSQQISNTAEYCPKCGVRQLGV